MAMESTHCTYGREGWAGKNGYRETALTHEGCLIECMPVDGSPLTAVELAEAVARGRGRS